MQIFHKKFLWNNFWKRRIIVPNPPWPIGIFFLPHRQAEISSDDQKIPDQSNRVGQSRFQSFFRHRSADKRKPGKNAPLCACFNAHSLSLRPFVPSFILPERAHLPSLLPAVLQEGSHGFPLIFWKKFFRFIFPDLFPPTLRNRYRKERKNCFQNRYKTLFLRVPSRFPNRTDHWPVLCQTNRKVLHLNVSLRHICPTV